MSPEPEKSSEGKVSQTHSSFSIEWGGRKHLWKTAGGLERKSGRINHSNTPSLKERKGAGYPHWLLQTFITMTVYCVVDWWHTEGGVNSMETKQRIRLFLPGKKRKKKKQQKKQQLWDVSAFTWHKGTSSDYRLLSMHALSWDAFSSAMMSLLLVWNFMKPDKSKSKTKNSQLSLLFDIDISKQGISRWFLFIVFII